DNSLEGLTYFRKALATAEGLSAANPSNTMYRQDIAEHQLGVGEALDRLGKNEEALRMVTRALELAKSLVAAAPEPMSWTRTITRAYGDLGDVLLKRGDVAGALENYRAALASAEKSLERAPSSLNLARDRADAFEALGRYYRTLAAQSSAPPARRAELSAHARVWFGRSLDVWQDWTKRKRAAPYAEVRGKQAAAAVASCDRP